MTDTVLGGFRVMLPLVDEDSQAGSSATMDISGGSFECSAEFPGPSEDNNAACSGGCDRGSGPVFDLTGSTRFLIDVESVEGTVSLGVSLVDANEEISVTLVPVLSAGQLSLGFNELFPLTSPTGADFALIDNIALTIIFAEGLSGRIVLNEFSTDGTIAEGRALPVDDDIAAEEIPGTYINPERDGEGCQLTLERDQVTQVLTCYFYDAGEQFWLIGTGERNGMRVLFEDMVITYGTGFGSEFDPAQVVREVFGDITVDFSDCNSFTASVDSERPEFQDIELDMTKIVAGACP